MVFFGGAKRWERDENKKFSIQDRPNFFFFAEIQIFTDGGKKQTRADEKDFFLRYKISVYNAAVQLHVLCLKNAFNVANIFFPSIVYVCSSPRK